MRIERVKYPKFIYFAICLSIWISSVPFPAKVFADTNRTGVVSITSYVVATRERPSEQSAQVNNLADGKPLQILGEEIGDDGYKWYKVRYTLIATGKDVTAYIRSDYVTVTGGAQPSTDTRIASGVIHANNVFVRDRAGTTDTNKLAALNRGTEVSIYGQTMVNGTIWYYITCTYEGNELKGWVHGDYITVSYVDSGVDDDYAKELLRAGFPESYIANLTALHRKYPKWKFEAVQTGLNWEKAVESESTNGRNLVQNTADDAKKSTESGAYNWNTNTWTIYDGSSWVSAHKDYIAYCMDPRNFLDETNIFQFERLSYGEEYDISGVRAILRGTFMAGSVTDVDGNTFDYAQAFMDIGKDTGVSPYHLASRVRQEQGAGTSALISGTYPEYENYFNYFNYGAYGVTKEIVIQSGLNYAVKQGWNTRYKALFGGAALLGQNYILKGQDTLYFQKFNVVNAAGGLYAHQYMGNVTAAITEGQSVAKGYADKDQPFVFRIPVYQNMPVSAVTFTATGNPNNYLKALSVSGLSLTPAFNPSTVNYTIVVANSVSSVTISASPVSAKSVVSGTGSYRLDVGANTIRIQCKSQSGETRTYTVMISRQQQTDTPPEVPEETRLSSSVYRLGSCITGISPQTAVEQFQEKLTVEAGTIKILKADGTPQTGMIATGNKVALYDKEGTLKATYGIIVYGDVNGDGAVDALDMIKMNRHILGISSLTGEYLAAGDANRKNDGVDALDMIIMNRHILGLTTIGQ